MYRTINLSCLFKITARQVSSEVGLAILYYVVRYRVIYLQCLCYLALPLCTVSMYLTRCVSFFPLFFNFLFLKLQFMRIKMYIRGLLPLAPSMKRLRVVSLSRSFVRYFLARWRPTVGRRSVSLPPGDGGSRDRVYLYGGDVRRWQRSMLQRRTNSCCRQVRVRGTRTL